MISRQHLVIIQTIHQLGTLTAAAKHLHLTQSALTHTIKRLEQQVNTPIWQKEGRKLKFTQTGNYLLNLANRLLPQFEQAETIIKEYADGSKGLLRIGMECHPCYQWFLQLVRPFWQEWPKVDLDVKQKFQFGGISALVNHDIDLLITPDPLKHKSLTFEAVFDYELVIVTSEQHVFKKKIYIDAEDLTTETLITYPVPVDRLDVFNAFLQPMQCLPKKHKQIESTDIILEMVAANRGVAVLPSWLAKNYSNKLPVQSTRLGINGINKRIYIAYRKQEKDINYLQSFIQLAQQTEENNEK